HHGSAARTSRRGGTSLASAGHARGRDRPSRQAIPTFGVALSVETSGAVHGDALLAEHSLQLQLELAGQTHPHVGVADPEPPFGQRHDDLAGRLAWLLAQLVVEPAEPVDRLVRVVVAVDGQAEPLDDDLRRAVAMLAAVAVGLTVAVGV